MRTKFDIFVFITSYMCTCNNVRVPTPDSLFTCVRVTLNLIPLLWLWRIFVELFFYWFNQLLHILICFQGKINSKVWSVLGRYYFPIKETRMTSIIRIAVNHNIISSLRIDFFFVTWLYIFWNVLFSLIKYNITCMHNNINAKIQEQCQF